MRKFRINKKSLIISSVISSALLLGSCNKYLDINNSPNSVTTIRPDLLFTYAEVAYGSNRSGGDYYLPLALAAQTQADGGAFGWAAGDAYDISTYSTGNMWSVMYTTGGNNLKLAYTMAESSTPANYAAAAQSKILLAQFLYEGTMLFGDIPYKEAFQPTVYPYPHFDAQKDVLDSIVALLDGAINEIPSSNAAAVTTADLFYTGDLTKWRKAATLLKLKIFMAMVDKDQTKAAKIADIVNNGTLFASSADNMKFPYGDTKGNQNPKFSLLDNYGLYLEDGRNSQFFAHRAIIDPMIANDDPRLSAYFDVDESTNVYKGLLGGEVADLTYSTISNKIFAATAPELIASYQEQLFLLAEIYARGIGVSTDLAKANTYYQEALEEACVYYGVDRTAANAWATSMSLLNKANPVDEIHLQQFIDMMDRPGDAFVNWRRSGATDAQKIPSLSIPDGSPAGALFHRWPYPVANEISANPNAPTDSPQYYDKLWFEQ